MKFFSTLVLSVLCATSALAQNINIGYPAEGTSLTAGANFTVEVDRPNSLSGSEEVAIVIALQSCPSSPCIPPADLLGPILYVGPYKPQYQLGDFSKPPYQNFSVVVPAAMAKGRAQLSVSHFALIGAGPEPYLELRNVTVNIV